MPMKHSHVSSIIASLIVLGISATPTRSAESKVRQQDEEAVQEVVGAFTAAVNKHDPRAFSMVFHEDADFTNIWGMRASGRKAIEDFHRPLFEGDGVNTPSFKAAIFRVLETKNRILRPDVIVVDVTWNQTGSVRDGKDWPDRKGLLMWVVTKERGVWAISVMHNMELPSVPPEAW